MTDDEFWTWISVLGGTADRQAVHRLTERLGDRAEAFQHRLDEMIDALDGSRFAGLPVRDVSDPGDADPLPLLGDALESFLLAVVAAGPETYRALRTDPAAATTRPWPFGEAGLLRRVHESITGTGWCRAMVFGGGGTWSSYADAVHEIAGSLNRRDDWRAWWQAGERDHLDLVIELGDDEHGTVRCGATVVRADFRLPVSRVLHRPAGVSARIAAQDVTRILTVVAGKAALPALPRLPWPASAEPPDSPAATRAARLAELRNRLKR
jgi:hypothetical protein